MGARASSQGAVGRGIRSLRSPRRPEEGTERRAEQCLPAKGAAPAPLAHPPRSPTDAPILALRGNDILKAWSRPVPFSIARGWQAGRPEASGGAWERGWAPGPQRQGHGRAGLGLSERRGSPQSMPAAPRLRRPRLPHRSGQCGGAPNAAAASLARQRGGGGPQEAAPPVRVLAGGAGGAGRAAGPGAGSGRGWAHLGGSGPQQVHYLISLPVTCAVQPWVLLPFSLAASPLLQPAGWGLQGSYAQNRNFHAGT